MTTGQIYKYTAISAIAAAMMLAAMLAVSLLNQGMTAQNFEGLSDVATYTSSILQAEQPLRLILTFDNFFLTFYTAAFVFLAMSLWRKDNWLVVAVALGALLFTAYLDLYENHDILTQLTTALLHQPISFADLQHRMIWSQLKFHSSYLGFFLFAFVLPRDTGLERLLKLSLWFVYLPVGILVYTFPSPIFELLRYLFMLAGLAILGWNNVVRFQKSPEEPAGT